MSRVGKNPVEIVEGVNVSLENDIFTAKGKLGELTLPIRSDVVDVKIEEKQVVVTPLKRDEKFSVSMWGTTRANINNAILGVSEGFSKELELKGVGYKAVLKGNTLVLSLSYSHDIDYPLPEGIKAELASPTEIKIVGADKQKVGQVASEIRSFRKPEPYKGKGVRYKGEYVRKKEGKKK